MLSITHFEAGTTFNVVPDSALIEGTLRTYDKESREVVGRRIIEICENIGKSMECTVDVTIMDKYPAVINHEKETNHIERLAKTCLGPEHFSQQDLPLMAGEDFSFFL